jgi:hypothetical protein
MADSDKNEIKPDDPRNPLNHLNARVGMALAFWAYPQPDIKKANEIVKYPQHWKHVEVGVELPADWPVAKLDAKGRLEQGSPQGWNTQHNKEGKLENQFMVSINRDTKQITFDFKGSDARSNWVSDFGNAGASEFAKIQAQAQKAFEAISKDERYKDYHVAATGHSLGGGMAQSFALKNNLDAYVYNSLPIARDTIKGEYFREAGGFDAALARYKASNHMVQDVRTPNDIATWNFDGVIKNQYLSQNAASGITMLPGASMPVPIKTVTAYSGYGTPLMALMMGKDHTMGAMLRTQHGLALSEQGQYRIPEGHVDYASIPEKTRRLFHTLTESPPITAVKYEAGNPAAPHDRYTVTHEDGSHQQISVDTRMGWIDVTYYNQDGLRSKSIEMRSWDTEPATVIEYDVNGNLSKTEKISLQLDESLNAQFNHFAQQEMKRTAGEIIRDRILENMAKNPEFLSQLIATSNNIHLDLPQSITRSDHSNSV